MNTVVSRRASAGKSGYSCAVDAIVAEATTAQSPGQEIMPGPKASILRALPVLFKLRVVSLLLFAAVGGAFIGAGGWPSFSTLLLLLVTGGLAASGASALNQYIERESDATMVRTRRRPLVDGTISRAGWVPPLGLLMIALPVLLTLPFNAPLAIFLALGAFIYVGVYTIWLKPRTLLNIVIGGAAGAAAVLAGSAAAGNWSDPGALVLALLVFLWTPTHFWSLAIVYRNDYARSSTPMLPVIATPRQSALWVLAHTGATALAALALSFHPALGWLYLIPVSLATVDMFVRNLRLLRNPSGKNARSLFMASNIYLAVVLVMLCVDAAVKLF